MGRFARAFAIGSIALLSLPSHGRVIHEETSLYRNILVRQSGSEICLLFTVRRSDRSQSCKDMDDPQWLVFPYARMMHAGLLYNPQPRRVLTIGLGGGTLPESFARLFPDAEQDVVEIDPAVVQVARDYFDFSEAPGMSVHVRDARVFIKRALAAGETYDFIMLDAFTGDYIPEHLMTREFLEEVQGLLTEGGVVVANTFATSRLYDHESATYAAVFPHVAELKQRGTGNRILVATQSPLPDRDTLQQRAIDLAGRVRGTGMEPRRYARSLDPDFAWDADARVLTDQFAPANLLQGR